jgi:hypothetical protein
MTIPATPSLTPLITDAQLADLLTGYDHVPGAVIFAQRVLPRLQDVRDAYELRLAEMQDQLDRALVKQAAYISLDRFNYRERRKLLVLIEQYKKALGPGRPLLGALEDLSEANWLLHVEAVELRARLAAYETPESTQP